MTRLRSLFFGTSAFAVPSLRAFAECTDVAGVVTQPDRPSGRGQKHQPTPVKAAALELGLPVYEPEKLKAFARDLQGEHFDLFALASYGRILPGTLLALPRLGALNVHPSLLPAYRGATPIQSAIRNGERETGVTIMLMDEGMDTGDIVLQEPVAIAPDDTYGTLHDRLAVRGAAMLVQAVELARHGAIPRRPQTGTVSVTAPIRKDDLVLNLASWTPERIVNTVRAFAPSPAARLETEDGALKVLQAHADADGKVSFDVVVPPGKRPMRYDDYLRGRGR